METRAILSMIQQPIQEHLGVAAIDREGARAVGGDIIKHASGEIYLPYETARGILGVIFREKCDKPTLAVTALEIMSLPVDPSSGRLKRTDIPMPPSYWTAGQHSTGSD